MTLEAASHADDVSRIQSETPPPVTIPPPDLPPDLPPESFWLSKDAELDWMDQNAFLDRKDSGKGSDPNPNHHHNPNLSAASSQRFIKKSSKAWILGLPKLQKSSFKDAKHRKNPANVRLFPKRSEPEGKPDDAVSALPEPSSPKVSCMGRVRSRRDKNRRAKSSKISEPEVPAKELNGQSEPDGVKRKGTWKRLSLIFGFGRKNPVQKTPSSSGKKGKKAHVTEEEEEKSRGYSIGIEPPPLADGETPMPGLGGMMRFTSGRRSDAWADDVLR